MAKRSFPMTLPDAPNEQRFKVDDLVAHCGGLIEWSSKRQISEVIGYNRNGGVQYRIKDPSGMDRGLAYDCELDPWPGDDAVFPIVVNHERRIVGYTESTIEGDQTHAVAFKVAGTQTR